MVVMRSGDTEKNTTGLQNNVIVVYYFLFKYKFTFRKIHKTMKQSYCHFFFLLVQMYLT